MTEIIGLHGFTGSPSDIDLLDHSSPTWQHWRGLPYTDLIDATDSYEQAFSKIAQRIQTEYQASSASPKVLFGYSQGGRLALQYALENPDHFDALILVGAFYGYASQEDQKKRQQQDKVWLDLLQQNDPSQFLGEWSEHSLIVSQRNIQSPTKERLQSHKTRLTTAELRNSIQVIGAAQMPYLLDQVPTLRIPTLYLAGENDLKYQAIGKEIKNVNSAIQTASVADAGHACHFENNLTFHQYVDLFLDRLPSK